MPFRTSKAKAWSVSFPPWETNSQDLSFRVDFNKESIRFTATIVRLERILRDWKVSGAGNARHKHMTSY